MTSKKPSKNSLEQSLRRLEEIVDAMESGSTPLDDAVELYEEGIRIAKECAIKLKAAELRIKKLSNDLEEEFSSESADGK